MPTPFYCTQRGISKCSTSVAWLVACVAALTAGCNADPGSRREIAILKSEIIALENKYYSLKSRCGDVGDDCATASNFAPEAGMNTVSTDQLQIDPGYASPEPIPTSQQLHSPNNPTAPTQTPVQEELNIEFDDGKGKSAPASSTQRLPQRSNATMTAASRPLVRRAPQDLNFTVAPFDMNRDQMDDGFKMNLPIDSRQMPTEIQISVLDPQLPNGKQRIAYWRYDEQDIRGLQRDGAGITLSLPFTSTPKSQSLLVFARAATGDTMAEGSQSLLLQLDSSEDLIASTDSDISKIDSRSSSPHTTATENPTWRPNR